ncbi:transforming growth factor-beta-induced protein ig-h3-like [Saccostrea cucullata]|uniref:transforming growth factor-beta-induced protein ig-h3-like n=1 Tax=Saccostrea cuccullata TaxID=36930 RepID=UPI002ED1E67F
MLALLVTVFSLQSLFVHGQLENVFTYLQNQGNFTTLVKLLKQSGLAGTLATSATPLTIFAPTDAAFAKLPQSVLDRLSGDPQALADTLKFHVTSGIVISPMLQDGKVFTTLSGKNLTAHRYDNQKFVIQGVEIDGGDKIVLNGVVHPINSVLMPADVTISEYLGTHETQFSDLYAALVLEGLEKPLETGTYTIFAPKDSAFAQILANLPSITADDAYFKKILMYHVVPGVWFSAGLTDGMTLPTLAGTNLTISLPGSGVYVKTAQVIDADIPLANGCLHVIDDVLTPPK